MGGGRMSKHWTTKLKEENAKLKADLYKILDGDITTITVYKTSRKISIQAEKTYWNGSINNIKL